MTKQRFLALLKRYIADQLSDEEMNEWLQAMAQEEFRTLFEKEIRKTFYSFGVDAAWNEEKKSGLLADIKATTGMKETGAAIPPLLTVKRGSSFFSLKKYGWAAAALLLVGIGSYFTFNGLTGRRTKQVISQSPTTAAAIPPGIKAPQSNYAVITLANGEKVFLDSAGSGTLASQGNVRVLKLAGGQIAYTGSSTEITYNTLSNPKGSRVVNMTLADGSRVWLNAGSSLTYPVAFVGNERRVEISGEAYFEVAPNTAMPFIVKKQQDDMEIQVLGTHFNVNAYADESVTKVTLLQGSVQVSKGNNSNRLLPAQQAQVQGEKIKLVRDVDIDEVIAWKNDRFQFGEKADIGTIMRQISRWYDVDIQFQGAVDQHLGGSISRQEDISTVLKMLEKTGVVRFSINGRKITVMPITP